MDLSKITMYEACLLHSRAERILKSLVSKHLEKYGLTRMEWILLASVHKPPVSVEGHTMGELAKILDIRLSQVTALVSNMQEASLLTQKIAKQDKRTRFVAITRKGNAMLENIETNMRQAMREWLSGIPREQLAIYMQTVKQLGYEV